MSGAKLVLLIDRFGSGGAQTQMALLCKNLIQRGYAVTVITYHHNDLDRHQESIEGAKLIELKKRGRWDHSVVRSIVQILRDVQPGALVSFLSTPNVYASLAAVISGFKGSLILSERNTFRNGGRPSISQYVKRLALYRANWIVANSHTQ